MKRTSKKGYNKTVGNKGNQSLMSELCPSSIDPNGIPGVEDFLFPCGGDEDDPFPGKSNNEGGGFLGSAPNDTVFQS